ncbi:MAG: hypothetical protein ACOH2L_04410 [Devosia sp.]
MSNLAQAGKARAGNIGPRMAGMLEKGAGGSQDVIGQMSFLMEWQTTVPYLW